MSFLDTVKNMVKARRLHCEVVKPSPEASRLAAMIGKPLSLSPATAAKIEAISADMMKRSDPHPSPRYETVSQHFASASSSRNNLALWETLVRERGSSSILEIGTAYGLSAIAMATAQAHPKLTTIDFFEPQASIGPENIRKVFPEGVECIKQDKNVALPALQAAGRRFDLVFHDGGHAGDDYVNDFNNILPMLEPNSTYVIDDIAWDNNEKIRRNTMQSARTCYEGWLEVLGHERVAGGIVRGGVGILLLN